MAKSTGFWARVRRTLLYLVLAWFVITIALVLAMRWINPFTSAFIVEDRITATVDHDPAYKYRHAWVGWSQISPWMKLAVICSEDQRFPDHNGFDLKQIDDAMRKHENGGRLRGASTISQQTAKNIFLWSGPSWIRKGFEVYFTLLIELLWSKQRILEIYLNSAEFGRGVFGVGAASSSFFHKPASQLNAYEAALVAAVLPSPKRFHAEAPSNYIKQRAAWIMGQMQHLGGTSYLDEL
jgi:monofunctional biosynthetic peptidoglycan transglycosylase